MPPDTDDAGFEHLETAWIDLPDEVRLAARIWLPEDARSKPAPAVLEYLPYRRRDVTAPRDESVYPEFARRGIAGVRVDLRGTGDSDGFFDDEYSETELSDAEAVIAWIAAQPWCSGDVGMMGISWGGFNALQVAARQPPALKAVISIASSVDRFADDIHYKGGAHLSAQLYWSTTMHAKIARPPDNAVVGERWREMWLARLERNDPLILTWLTHQRRDAYWHHGSICDTPSALQAPALLIAGWADGYRCTPWKAMDLLNPASKAITGPWVHKYPHFALPHPRLDFITEAEQWWKRSVGREASAAGDLPRHRLFIAQGIRPGDAREQEAGRWVRLDETTPLKSQRLYLTTENRLAVSPNAQGQATLKSPLDCGVDSGEYFTQDVVYSLAGDQRCDDGLSLCFETPPLETPLDVAGAPKLHLRVAIDAPVGNLIARLVDVHSDNTSHRVSLGVLNLTHRDGSETPNPMTPGETTSVTITLDTSGYRFLAGHRLRLALSTNYFPYILPPPTEITAMLTLDEDTWLELPTPPLEDIEVLPPATDQTLPVYPGASPGSGARTVRRDLSAGRTVVTTQEDTGVLTHPANGMTWRETRLSEWSITRNAPLSLKGNERMTAIRRRDGVETRVTASSRLTCSPNHWIIEASLLAWENDVQCFERSWRREIERDLM